MDFQLEIAREIANALSIVFGETGITAETVAGMLETPPDPTTMGDYAFPCFKLSKTLRKSPVMISDALAPAITNVPARIESVKGYVNFFIDRALYAQEVIQRAERAGDQYGGGDFGRGKTIVIDYSSINIAKRFHIGHLSTTMIGNALYNMYKFCGYTCVGVNHLGDWGTQFGKMIAAYQRWGSEEAVRTGGIDEMTRLYVRFNAEAEKDPTLNDEGRAWFKKIEDGDEEALRIFGWFKEVTLRDAARVYDMLGITFDSYAGESFYNDKMGRVVDELTEKGLLVEDAGAKIVRLDDDRMPPAIILRSDGASLYATRDIAAALYRMDTYHFDRCLYVVAYQQDLHFRQWFKVLSMMGYDWADRLTHVSFGMVSYEGQALSTRGGHVVYLEDLLNKAIEKALTIIEEKSPELPDKEAVAKQIGIGAVIFFDLYNGRIKDIDFRWDRALNFDGETGPYVMYTYARLGSVLRKAGDTEAAPDYHQLEDDEAQALIKWIDRFPDTVREALDRSEPSLVTRFSAEIAKAANKFYYERRILDDDPGARAARLQLVRVARQTLYTALRLLGITPPERM